MPTGINCSNYYVAMHFKNRDRSRSEKASMQILKVIYKDCYDRKLHTYLYLMGCNEWLLNKILNNTQQQLFSSAYAIATQADLEVLNFCTYLFAIAHEHLFNHINEIKELEFTKEYRILVLERHLNKKYAHLSPNRRLLAVAISKLPLYQRDAYLLRRMGINLTAIAEFQKIINDEAALHCSNAIRTIQPFFKLSLQEEKTKD